MLKCLFFFLVTSLVVKGFSQQDTFPVVKINTGFVSGTRNAEKTVYVFKGIPFAAPPVGKLRWKAPQPALAWTGIRKCDSFAASAMQPPPVPFYIYSKEFMAPVSPISEDCLYLNVWAATPDNTAKRPVIVWIHGGGFTGGSGSVPVYDGEAMAKKGVVFVTINYRLGAFGFLAHPELSNETIQHSSGNYGLLDQLAALRWVKDNITGFGGDTTRITVAGQSAGAYSISALMASSLSKGLFQRVIAESGGMFDPNEVKTLKNAEQEGVQLINKLRVTNIEELRSTDAETILQAGGNFQPIVDGYILPATVYSIFKEGKQNDVDLLTGWNNDEGFAPPFPLSAEGFKKSAERKYGKLSDEFLKAFPATTDEEAKQSQKTLSRDLVFSIQNYNWAGLQTTTGKQKVFLYSFNREVPGEPAIGSFHSSEIAYALHTLTRWNRPWTNADFKLEELMSSYWVNFAATGDPNAENLPVWPAFELGKQRVMNFDKTNKAKNNELKKEFDVLNKYQEQLKK